MRSAREDVVEGVAPTRHLVQTVDQDVLGNSEARQRPVESHGLGPPPRPAARAIARETPDAALLT